MSCLTLLKWAAAWSLLVQQPAARALVAANVRNEGLPIPPGLGAKDLPGLPTSLPFLPTGLPSILPGLPFSNELFSSSTPSTSTPTVSSTQETSSTPLPSTTTTILVFSSTLTTSSTSLSRVSSSKSPVSITSVLSTTLVTAFSSQATSPLSTSTSSLSNNTVNMSDNGTSGIGSNRTLVITLSTVLSVVGFLLIAGGILICWRYRRNRLRLFNRGITPIDDDEIATWKVSREEKRSGGPAAGISGAAVTGYGTTTTSNHVKNPSVGSTKKPPSVIVYPGARRSEEQSMRSVAYNSYGAGYGKKSFDNKELPQTPIQARAPNAREGLTDETVPGADPFLPSPKRHPSRLSKLPPLQSPRSAHTRTRSSRSSASMRSFGDAYGSEMELSPRTSHDYYWSSRRQSRAFSAAPPRLSFGDDFVVGGLSPRPLIRDDDIGRAIG